MQQTAVLDAGLDRPSRTDCQPQDAGGHAPAAATAELVARANLGEQAAWDQLVERYAGRVWAIARSHGLDPDDAAEVSQVTWLLLSQHLGILPQPERLGGWLHATATREAFRMCRLRGRQCTSPATTTADRSRRQEAPAEIDSA